MGYCNPPASIGNLAEADIGQRQSASTCLETLMTIGILEEPKADRERLFVNPALLALSMHD